MPADVAVIVIKQQIKAWGFRGRPSSQRCRRPGFSPRLLPNVPDTHRGGWPPRVLHSLPPPSPCGALRGIGWAAAGSPQRLGMLRGLLGPSRVLVLGRTPKWPGTSLQGAARRGCHLRRCRGCFLCRSRAGAGAEGERGNRKPQVQGGCGGSRSRVPWAGDAGALLHRPPAPRSAGGSNRAMSGHLPPGTPAPSPSPPMLPAAPRPWGSDWELLGPAGTPRRAGISQGKTSGARRKEGLRDYRCERQNACWSLESICSPLGRGKRGPFPADPNLPRKEEEGTLSTTSRSSPRRWGGTGAWGQSRAWDPRGGGDVTLQQPPPVPGAPVSHQNKPCLDQAQLQSSLQASCLRPAPCQQPTAAPAPLLGIIPVWLSHGVGDANSSPLGWGLLEAPGVPNQPLLPPPGAVPSPVSPVLSGGQLFLSPGGQMLATKLKMWDTAPEQGRGCFSFPPWGWVCALSAALGIGAAHAQTTGCRARRHRRLHWARRGEVLQGDGEGEGLQ